MAQENVCLSVSMSGFAKIKTPPRNGSPSLSTHPLPLLLLPLRGVKYLTSIQRVKISLSFAHPFQNLSSWGVFRYRHVFTLARLRTSLVTTRYSSRFHRFKQISCVSILVGSTVLTNLSHFGRRAGGLTCPALVALRHHLSPSGVAVLLS